MSLTKLGCTPVQPFSGFATLAMSNLLGATAFHLTYGAKLLNH